MEYTFPCRLHLPCPHWPQWISDIPSVSRMDIAIMRFFWFFLAAVAIYFLHWHLQFLPQKTSHSSASLWSALSCFFPPRKHKYSSYVIFVRVQVPSCVIILHISRWAPELSIEICAFFVSSYSLTLIFFLLSKSDPLSGDRMWGEKRAGGPVCVNLRWQLSKLIIGIVFSVFQCFSCHVEKKVIMGPD